MDTTYYSLGSKYSFNKALRHFFSVNEIVDEIEDRNNLADIIWEQLDDEDLDKEQILPIIGSIIRDKFQYSYASLDIPETVSDFSKIAEETIKWTGMDIVVVYYNPNGQIYVINPKNEEQWSRVGELTSDHLLVIYAKYLTEEDGDKKVESDALKAVEDLLLGRNTYINKDFIDNTIVPQKPVKKAAAVPTGKRRATPKYSVQVTNELFHNGNVEAWKKIIESYLTKYPDLEVNIFYEGEVINDINTLFKWGKVKHGGLIFIQVVGENIQGVSKLQKYLFEGASHRFEQFLKAGVGKVLNLF